MAIAACSDRVDEIRAAFDRGLTAASLNACGALAGSDL
jgi:hypothetical protein